jgi:hypothetical protein
MAKSQLRKLGYGLVAEDVMSQTQFDNDGTVTIVWTGYMIFLAEELIIARSEINEEIVYPWKLHCILGSDEPTGDCTAMACW